MILPFFTNTAPTVGFGDVVPQPRRARRNAMRMKCSSTDLIAFVYSGNYSWFAWHGEKAFRGLAVKKRAG
jgi:hypothetical protein